MKIILLLFLLFTQFQVKSQISQKVLDSLYNEIEFLIGDYWFLEKTETGFQVTYCKSCGEAYKNYIQTTNFFSRELFKKDFFKLELIDSVSYVSTVSNLEIPDSWTKKQKNEYFSKKYKASDILRFNVYFEAKWSNEKFNSILSMNNQLRDSILLKPLYKTSKNIFSDYRFWLPDKYLQERTKNLDFYFERLPYSSLTFDASIFILHNKPFYFAAPILVDKSDPEFYDKMENRLESERVKTLKIIALCLGIYDYKVLN